MKNASAMSSTFADLFTVKFSQRDHVSTIAILFIEPQPTAKRLFSVGETIVISALQLIDIVLRNMKFNPDKSTSAAEPTEPYDMPSIVTKSGLCFFNISDT
jgi:hypothetical protein